MLNAGTRTPITSLQYFADIVEEVNDAAIPESYWEPLRSKMVRMEQQWQQGNKQELDAEASGTARLPRITKPTAHITHNAGPHPTQSTIVPPDKARNEMTLTVIYLPFS
jgi:hypothetical protein